MKRKRRKVALRGKGQGIREKEIIMNSAIIQNKEAVELISEGKIDSLKEFMSRGQRKRFKKFEKRRKKNEVVKKIKRDFGIPHSVQENDLSESNTLDDEIDQVLFLDMKDLETELDKVVEDENFLSTKKPKMTHKRRQRMLAEEIDHFEKVVNLEAYMSNPMKAIQEHLNNKIELTNQESDVRRRKVHYSNQQPKKKKKKRRMGKKKKKKKLSGDGKKKETTRTYTGSKRKRK